MIDKGGVKYVNVDTTHPAGLRHARENGLATSGLADVVSSHLFTGSLQLFTDEVKGKAFTIFRHPIERAVSMFFYLGSEQAKHEKTYDSALKTMTIEEFSKSNKIEDKFSLSKCVVLSFLYLGYFLLEHSSFIHVISLSHIMIFSLPYNFIFVSCVNYLVG
jgi:hypothetical protein